MRRTHLTFLGLCAGMLAVALATTPVAAATVPIVFRHAMTTNKVIALTFDDGYSPTNAQKIVQILDQYGATATFFPYANAALQAPATWKAIGACFPIGDHTTTHPHLPTLTNAQISWEISNARQVIEAMIGRPMIPVFRPPYMDYNLTVLQDALQDGFTYMALWSIDTQDAERASAQTIYSRAIQGGPGGVILMHAGPPATVQALPGILDYFRSQGYRFVTIPQLVGIPWSPTPGASCSPGSASTGTGIGTLVGCVCPGRPQVIPADPVYLTPSARYRAEPV